MSNTAPEFDPFASMNSSVIKNEQSDDGTDFDQFLSTLTDGGWTYGNESTTGPDGSDAPAEDPDDGGDGQVEEPPPVVTGTATPPADGTIRIGDSDVPLSEVQALYEIGKTFRDSGIQAPAPQQPPANPPPVAAAPVVDTPPEWIDQDDPVQMGMWNELQATRSEVVAVRAQGDQAIAAANTKRINDEVNQAIAAFKTDYPDITDAEVNNLRLLAAPTAQVFVSTATDPVAGLKKALYVAGLDLPATRDKILKIAHTTRQNASAVRKAKQSSIGGSSGSAPRTTPPARTRPTSDRAATSQFADALAESFGQSGRLN